MGISITDDLREEVSEMCNFSEGVAYRASEKGQNQLRALYRYLKDSGRIEDAERVMDNEHFANEMYEKYKDQLQLSK